MRRRVEVVDRESFDLRPEHMITIRFTGEIEPRVSRSSAEIKGKLFFVRPGDVVYSKIDVRNGAIGMLPSDMAVATVTSEFPVYEIDHAVAVPQYVQLLFRTVAFRLILNSRISGASGRKRVQPGDLEQIQVPLPDLPTQQAIVARAQEAEARRRAASNQAEAARRDAVGAFITALGYGHPALATAPRAITVKWSETTRWGVAFNRARRGAVDHEAMSVPHRALGELLEFVQYGTSKKADGQDSDTPVLRMGNVVGGRLDFRSLKYVKLGEKDRERLALQPGDILINRTNSKELVGKSAVFRGNGLFVFASYLIRLRVDPSVADPDYVAAVLNSPIGRGQISVLSRQIIGQANINSTEIRGLHIPVPPLLRTQQELASAIMEKMAAADEMVSRAEHEAQASMADVEEMIVGTFASGES